jgi:hypothetical protein
MTVRSIDLRKELRNCDSPSLTSNFINLKGNLAVCTEERVNLDKFKLGGLYEKHGVATYKLGTILAFV